MQTPSHESSLDLAPQSCQSCRSRKRKCDKARPRCSLCAKRNQNCEYWRPEAPSHSATTSSPERGWYPFPVDEADVQTIDFPTILFLDPALLQHSLVEIAPTAGTVPQYILQLLGDLDEIRLTAARFFEHIHQWMPFISKKRFYDLYLQPSFHSRPDVVLLLLALKLITTFPPAGSRSPRTALYNSTKHFYLKVEGSFSILALQAGVLVALYELGHGIYPAAFLSVGACARYAHGLGINVSRTVPTRKVLTLVEVEERRRVWWAIVILDRFVSIGCPGRPFVTADPRLDDFLPADDAAWDQGTVRPDRFSTLSSPMTGHMSKFALLCQATRLLGQVLHHLSADFTNEDDVWIQLDRTLQSMLAAALNIDCPDYDQITFVYSALVALYTPWLSSGGVQEIDTDRSRRARVILQQITDRISANLIERQCFLGRDPEDMSPWGLYFAYRICGAHMGSSSKAPHGIEVVRSLREGFMTINVRWNVAGVYLQLLEAQEAIHLGA
ncbi:hypothetical protein N7499_010559 [Penicillium canescens]|uniref:Zn(2)-C6 fungal-type domain-containing protein n=1 Tax=Penicillium canescens TaxID=5083 RepID=A0AAD6IKC5_PENCN|nr:uncharacterized protein N7446_005827 [Penicillium canescens]KAJ6051196.1 hypothetical protein N7460_001730 [Penicillium canescens]KAJ6061707.1 hypothetical protein N7446_005827 [Penicillium canescens]KAJ6064955.1 hypothetical protein N7444_000608 [Penicillium canescens]KAJ6068672.1 hypothetical protein N7499_010559 [Penicillium canescens]KAJ6183274.1 hypothetical protein N7485_001916 [Penicillium canescens]